MLRHIPMLSIGCETKFFVLSCQRKAIVGCGLGVEPVLPKVVHPPAAVDTAESQDVFGTGFGPEHPGLFTSPDDDGLTSGLHDARTDEVTGLPEGAILHPADIADEIVQSLLDGGLPGRADGLQAGLF